MFRYLATILLLTTLSPVIAQAGALSGDRLYDAFAQLVEENSNRFDLPGLTRSLLENRSALPTDILQSLEGEFSGDARYWELLTWSMETRTAFPGLPSNTEPDPAETMAQATKLLSRGVDCGNASPYAMYRLAWLERRLRQIEIDGVWLESIANGDQSLGQAPQDARERLIEMNRNDEVQYLSKLDEIVQRWPDEAWPHYWKADFYFEIGEMEQASAQLELGNEARDCTYPALFPESFVRQRMWDSQPCGNKWIAGAVADSWQIRANWNRWKERAKEINVVMALGGDAGVANALQGFACRTACAPGSSSLDSIAALVVCDVLGSGILDTCGGSLTQERLDVLLHARDLSRRAREGFVRTGFAYDYFAGTEAAFPVPAPCFIEDRTVDFDAYDAVLRSTIKLVMPAQRYMDKADLTLAEFSEIKTVAGPACGQLALLDYNTLAWPEAWGPPE